MPPSEIKKYVVSFLVLSILTSSSIFVWARFSPPDPVHTGWFKDEPRDTIAFVEGVPSRSLAENRTIVLSSGAEMKPTGNYTKDFTAMLVQNTLSQNPDGVLLASAGELPIPKELDGFMGEYSKSEAVSANTLLPKVQSEKIHVQKNATDADEYNYRLAFQEILDSPEAQGIENGFSAGRMDDGFVSSISLFTRETKERLYALPVPESMQAFHSAFLESIETQDKYFSLLNADPLKAAVLLETFVSIQEKQVETITGIVNDIALLPSSPGNNNAGFLQGFFGIEKANAGGYPVIDVTHIFVNKVGWLGRVLDWIVHYGQILLEWLDEIATEWLKNKLLNEFSNMVIAWVNGEHYDASGAIDSMKSQFVTNWKGYLKQAGDLAAGALIEEVAPFLCDRFGPLLTLTLNPNTNMAFPHPGLGFGCTLSGVVNNIEAFQDSFSNGGWIGYTTLLEPHNNLFGATLSLSNTARVTASEAEEAANNEAVAGGGSPGTKIQLCDEGLLYEDGGTNPDPTKVGRCVEDNPPEYTVIGYPGEETTTPGSTITGVLKDTVKAPIDRIVNAMNWKALVIYLVGTMALKLFDSQEEGISYGDTTRAGTVSSGAACSGFDPFSPEYQNCLRNINPTQEIPPLEDFDGLTPEDVGVGDGGDGSGATCNNPVMLTSEGGRPGPITGLSIPGSFFTPSVNEPIRVIPLTNPQMEPDINFSRASVDVDVTLPATDTWYIPDPTEDPKKRHHNLFWLHRSGATDATYIPMSWGENVVGYVNFVKDLNGSAGLLRMGWSLNRNFNCALLEVDNSDKATLAPGNTYHVSFVYDTRTKTISSAIHEKLPDGTLGTRLAFSQGAADTIANIIQSDNPQSTRGKSGFFISFGHFLGPLNGPDAAPEAPTYGWTYSNLDVLFEP